MDHPAGAGLQRAERVDFDRRVRLKFRGTQLGSDGGLLVMRELDDALGLSDPGCFRDRRHRAGQKTLDRVASLGNLEVKRQATWGISVEAAEN